MGAAVTVKAGAKGCSKKEDTPFTFTRPCFKRGPHRDLHGYDTYQHLNTHHHVYDILLCPATRWLLHFISKSWHQVAAFLVSTRPTPPHPTYGMRTPVLAVYNDMRMKMVKPNARMSRFPGTVWVSRSCRKGAGQWAISQIDALLTRLPTCSISLRFPGTPHMKN